MEQETTKHILVTGGAGYIGSHTAKELAMRGYIPVTYDDLSRGYRSAVQFGPFIQGDIADSVKLRETLEKYKIVAVMHFAAFAYVGESMADPAPYFHNNVAKALSLIDTVRKAGIRSFVFSSTCATYGMPDVFPITESVPQRPMNPYGESKLMVERILDWFSSLYDFRSVSLRYFNAAGADPDGELGESHEPETHLIPLVLRAASGGSPVRIFGDDYPTADGTCVRDYIHVRDLADAHVKALAYLMDGGASGKFNLGTGTGHSVREILQKVEEVTGQCVKYELAPRRHGDPSVLVADASLARQVLFWKPKYSDLESIIRTAWNWHLRSHDK